MTRRADDARDRRDVADEIEIELVVERRVDRVGRSDQEQRIAVRWRTHDRLGGDIGAGARPVLDDEWLAEPLRQPLCPSGARGYRSRRRRESRRSSAPAASDRFAPARNATPPAARQRPRPDARIVRRGSFIVAPPSRAASFDHLVGAPLLRPGLDHSHDYVCLNFSSNLAASVSVRDRGRGVVGCSL